MIAPLSYASTELYKNIIKPILFRTPPDTVHHRLVRTGRILQRIPPVLWLVRAVWSYRNETHLSQNAAGLHFKNPIGLSAGFDKNFELVPLLRSTGFGLMEGGSLTYYSCEGNPRPWFHRLPKSRSLVVFAGLANHGSEKIIARIGRYSPRIFKDFPLNISVAKTNSKQACTDELAVDDYASSVRAIKKAGVGAMVTLNISCPNTYGGEPFTTPERLERLLTEIDAIHLGKPLFIKMPSDLPWSKFKQLVAVADKHNVQGLTIANLAKDRKQANLKDHLPDDVKGNLSGKPVGELSNELIRQTYRAYGERFVIIGVGGVFSAGDAYTKIKLGASLVELITGVIFEGPQLIGQINRDLVRLLQADGYTNISQAIGADNRRS